MKKIFKKEKIKELSWFESWEFKGIKIVLLPAKHWSKRRLFDRNTSLWGSFLIQTDKTTIYYAGDTAYSYHFKDIGEIFEIDYAFLPIGAYKPDYIMKHNHMNPEEAYKAFKDLNAKHFIPIHYGVFKLSDESVSEPYEKIVKIIPENKIPKIGEVVII
ncbi:MBL fold metallo-hydrolase [Thermotomaculum hydrothermale]|uniref:MBL fold metallo-hydrolase n=1 Tax=Thermotomaculum hydrothermale TaxID=981385 RepID=UPI001914EDE1|nr:MBL fold metallo-hydrolase [Thermotomaculum hydrothermale]